MSSKILRLGNSGLQIDPFAEFQNLLVGTSFEDNKEAQGNLEKLAEVVPELSLNWKGRELVDHVEDLAKTIRTEGDFKEIVKICFRHHAKNFSKNPWVQFGIFLALFGLVFALNAATGPELVTVARAIAITCATSALTSDGIEKFVEGSDAFI